MRHLVGFAFALTLFAGGLIAGDSPQAQEADASPEKSAAHRKFDQKIDEAIEKTNRFIEKNLIDTANYDALGPNYGNQGGCLRSFTCKKPEEYSLNKLIDYALSSSPRVESSRASYAASLSEVGVARWSFWPTPKFGLRHRTTDDAYYINAGIEQPLWTGGKLTSALDISRINAVIAETIIATEQIGLSIEIVENYASWLAADLRRLQWLETLKLMEDVIEQVERQQKSGSLSMSERNQAYSRYETARAELLSAEAAGTSALAILSQLIGTLLDPNLIDASKVRLPTLMGDARIDPDQIRQNLYAYSPYIARARAQIALAEARIRETRASTKPSIIGVLERDQFFNSTKSESRGYIEVRSNFVAGLSAGSSEDAAAAELNAARAALLASERNVRSEITSARALYRASQQRAAALRGAIKAHRRYYESIKRLFASSGRSSYDVLTSAYDVGISQGLLADAQAAILQNGWKYNLYLRGFTALDR